jgi:hypothetical protein
MANEHFPLRSKIILTVGGLLFLGLISITAWAGYQYQGQTRSNTDFVNQVHAQHLGNGISDPELIQAGMWVCVEADQPTTTAALVAGLGKRSNFPAATAKAVIKPALQNYCPVNESHVK